MTTLTEQQQLYYITHKKSVPLTVILSIFLLPFAFLYTRGFFGWLGSVILLSIIFGFLQLLIKDTITLGGWSLGACTVYLIVALTDAGRVNNKLMATLSK